MKPGTRKAVPFVRNPLPKSGPKRAPSISPKKKKEGDRENNTDNQTFVKRARFVIEEIASQRSQDVIPETQQIVTPHRTDQLRVGFGHFQNAPQERPWPTVIDWNELGFQPPTRFRSPSSMVRSRRPKQQKLSAYGCIQLSKEDVIADRIATASLKRSQETPYGFVPINDPIVKPPDVVIEEISTQVFGQSHNTLGQASRDGEDKNEEDGWEQEVVSVQLSQMDMPSSQPAAEVLSQVYEMYGFREDLPVSLSTARSHTSETNGMPRRIIFPRQKKMKYLRGALAERMAAIVRADNIDRYLWNEKQHHIVPTERDPDKLPNCLCLQISDIRDTHSHLVDVYCTACRPKPKEEFSVLSDAYSQLDNRIVKVVFARNDLIKLNLKKDDKFALLRPWVACLEDDPDGISIYCPHYVRILSNRA